jgi:hypothetical protein
MSTFPVSFSGLSRATWVVLELIANRDEGVSFHEAIEAVGRAIGMAAATRQALGGSDMEEFKKHLEAGMHRGVDEASTTVLNAWIEMHGGRQ